MPLEIEVLPYDVIYIIYKEKFLFQGIFYYSSYRRSCNLLYIENQRIVLKFYFRKVVIYFCLRYVKKTEETVC